MKRRGFLSSAAAAGALATVAAGGAFAGPLAKLSRPEDADGAFSVGQSYRSRCGRSMTLVAIDQQRAQSRCHGFRLRFEGEACSALAEGTHVLDGPLGETTLFLQPSEQGLVAWFNQIV